MIDVISILQNCSEVSSLCKTLIEIDVVSQLTSVADKVINDSFGADTQARKDSVILPILKTFEQLNQSDIDWHHRKQNMQQVMQKIRDSSTHNSKIVSLADNLMETLVDVEENESNQHPQDVTETTEAIL